MRSIQLYDTTLRDGSQSEGVSFSLQDKLNFVQKLDSFNFDFIEGGFPNSNEKDAEFFCRIAGTELQTSVVSAFGMTRRKNTAVEKDSGVLSLLNADTEIITVVGKASLFQAAEALNIPAEENLAMVAETVQFLRDKGKRVFFDAEHFFDGWKDNPVYSLKILKAAEEAGAEVIVLCDTNGGSLPQEIAAGIQEAVRSVKIPIGIHVHNDCGLATANSLAAVENGASQVQGTINGIGERTGNTDLITVAANLSLKYRGQYSVLKPESVEQLTELSRYVYEMLNWQIPGNTPYVGKSAFAHKGGMHVSAINKNPALYEHIDPAAVGNERRILISELSGRSNIIARTRNLKIDLSPSAINDILDEVVSKENQGYQYEAADGSFDLIVRRCTNTFTEHFKRLSYHVYVEADADGVLNTVATVKLQVNSKDGAIIRHEVAEGDGPVNALDAAMRKALLPHFEVLAGMRLIDFKVRVVNSEAATEAAVRVIVESGDKESVWSTIGASENVIEASWIALADSIEYKLNKQV
jgi:2-isopropylmalate synthase